ncbi:MAG: DUF4974 domain-containing protein, partial [Bacteroidetes bacterium]|nr:DUF4974 domain-containing protein [Bacteroidota bacterium]
REGKSEIVLNPGQQAALQTSSHRLQRSDNVNVEEVMAWKEGKFYFEKSNIKDVMNQISRWYDLVVEYKGEVPAYFGGTISRHVEVSKVLEMLQFTGAVNFKIEGKKVIVMP